MKLVHYSADGDHEFSSMVKDEVSRSFIFEHTFAMIVAGPSICGKTYWTNNLLLNANKRIKPTSKKIVYCYTHWQPKYEVLKNILILWNGTKACLLNPI
jgi:hypothetical protein